MSASAKNQARATVSDAASDDSMFSILSGSYNAEEPADSGAFETAPSISGESTDDKQDQPLFSSTEMSVSTALISKNISIEEGKSVASTNSDSDKQLVIITHNSEMIEINQNY